ncbi:MAG TPA: glycosyltransferase family 39 protein [Acidisarcina sp.]
MATVQASQNRIFSNTQPALEKLSILTIAAAVALLHIVTNNRYGFHRDELQFLSDASHMAWGFVAYPPFTPFVERISLALFGTSLVGLRLASVLAQSLVIIVTGLIARELGGHRLAQITAALAVALSPLPLFEGTEFQYTTFDYLWWVLIAFFIIRLVRTEEPRWWLAIGATVGLGLMTKYSITFYIAGILAGLLLTPYRRYFLNKWFWAGTALALLICGPNILWQYHHGFISYHFLHHIHIRDVGEGRANGFLRDQFMICTNLFAAPLWIGGLIAFLLSPKYRLLAWMYLVPFALFLFGKGRGYYVAATYPMLMAMGAVAAERLLASIPKLWARVIEVAFFAAITVCGVYMCTLIVPIAPSGRLRDFALKNNGDLREEIGWNELVSTVAGIRDSLPADQQASLGIIVGNYGEQGAIEILGRPYHLPLPLSGTNSAWLRGYPTPQPTTLIVVGLSRKYVDKTFANCRVAGHNGNAEGIHNEESDDHPDIFVCGPPLQSWPQFWDDYQSFG